MLQRMAPGRAQWHCLLPKNACQMLSGHALPTTREKKKKCL